MRRQLTTGEGFDGSDGFEAHGDDLADEVDDVFGVVGAVGRRICTGGATEHNPSLRPNGEGSSCSKPFCHLSQPGGTRGPFLRDEV